MMGLLGGVQGWILGADLSFEASRNSLTQVIRYHIWGLGRWDVQLGASVGRSSSRAVLSLWGPNLPHSQGP